MHYVIKCIKLCGEKVETSGLYLFIYFNNLCVDKQADGRVRVPRAASCQLSGLVSGGSPANPAGRFLRQHHQRERRQERTAAAHAGGTHQDCALHEGLSSLTFELQHWHLFTVTGVNFTF